MIRALLLLSLPAFAAAPKCLIEKPRSANLPDAAWVGKRFVVTWYEPSGASLEQKVMGLGTDGVLAASPAREATTPDGASSVMGRLAFNGTRLGLGFMDDGQKQRMAHFGLLDASGAPASPPFALTRAFLPHGDQIAVAWNAKTESWGAVFTGTLPTQTPGNVTHHQYFVSFRGEPGAPVQLDADESVTAGHNLALVPKGSCFLTTWTTSPTNRVMLGEVCEGQPVRRTVVSEGKFSAPMLPSLAIAGEEVLVVWVEDLPARPPSVPAAAPGAAPSRPIEPEPPQLQSDVFFALLDTKGVVKNRGSLSAPGLAQSPIVRFDGTDWWVSWADRLQNKESVFAARLTRDTRKQVERVTVGSGWNGPVWVTFAAAGATTNVLMSHPSDAPCVLSWARLSR